MSQFMHSSAVGVPLPFSARNLAQRMISLIANWCSIDGGVS